MHFTFVNQFRNCFPEMILALKIEAIEPLVRLFLEELESKGFSLEEILFAFMAISEDRGLRGVSDSLSEILSTKKGGLGG